jgi:UDP-galactopyranose mutase
MDYVAFSHLRWTFVYQRPNHLLARAARQHRVFFVEEPIPDATTPWLDVKRQDGVEVVVPHVSPAAEPVDRQLEGLIQDLKATRRITHPIAWYFTPMALPWSGCVLADARATVYDCMDDLASFRSPPARIRELEAALLVAADVVFTGGQSLYESRRSRHPFVHCFPSSVDVAHFGRARGHLTEPADQAAFARPRIGYFGVLDERLDWELLAGVAARRPDWELVLVGPTAKVDRSRLPAAPNLHYLGVKPYQELPAYLAGWDAAMMPFARNEATAHISPTKTPEYLAGGRPVASTPIRDIVEPYGRLGLVQLGAGVEAFVEAIERALRADRPDLQRRADQALAGRSWDATWSEMERLIEVAIVRRVLRRPAAIETLPAGPAPRAPGAVGARARGHEGARVGAASARERAAPR